MTKKLLSITLLALLFSHSAFADSASRAFCQSNLKDSGFYDSIRTSPMGNHYTMILVEENRFAMIQEELTKSIKQQCKNNDSFENITQSTFRICDLQCAKHVKTFNERMFVNKKKTKDDFQDDCQTTCFALNQKLKTFEQGFASNNPEVKDCGEPKESVLSIGRSMKKIERHIETIQKTKDTPK